MFCLSRLQWLVVGAAVLPDFAGAALSAISVDPSQYWDGNDGKWSSFGMSLGTPGQQIRVLPVSQQSTVYTVLPEGCTSSDPSTCVSDRGSVFLINRTSTWQQQGLYQLNLIAETPLGYSGNGLYGHDAATLGWPGNNLPGVNSTIIAGIATKDFYIGGLPLNPWPFNFTTLTQSTPSLMTNLKDQGKIPSLSYGYTAGYYRNNPPVFGSLTIGGYDKNRFVNNNVSFTMGADISRDLLVGIQSIDTGSTNLLSQPIFAFIDSAIPTIWLPLSVCQAFEKAFGLTWDASAGLYLVSDTLHTQLQQRNPSVKFKIGPQVTGDSFTIEMPYGAFDLDAQPPFTPNTSASRYFPLKRANDTSQYTLGRAFLQSAYIVANYEYFNFSVYQATYPSSSVSLDLVTLPAKGATNSGGGGSSLSTGAIVGIAVGGAALLLIAAVGIWYFIIRRKARNQPDYDAVPIADMPGPAQLHGDSVPVIYEAGTDPVHHEMGEGYKPAYKVQQPPVELPSNEVAAWEAHSEHSTPVAPIPSPRRSPRTQGPYRQVP